MLMVALSRISGGSGLDSASRLLHHQWCSAGKNTNTLLIFTTVTLLVFILLQAIVHPFKNLFVEGLDLFFMLNYWLIIEFYIVFHHTDFDSEFLAGAYVFFLSIATVAIFLILILHFCYVCVSWRNPRILQAKLYQKLEGMKSLEMNLMKMLMEK